MKRQKITNYFNKKIKVDASLSENGCGEKQCDTVVQSSPSVSVSPRASDSAPASTSTQSTFERDEGNNEPFQPLTIKYPTKVISGVNRSFKPEWYKKWSWLHWNSESESVKCFVCMKAKKLNLKVISKTKVDETFIISGFSNWKKASEKFSSHESSECHKASVASIMSFNQTPITAQLSNQINNQMIAAQKALISIVSSIKYLASRTMALRGHGDNEGNFYELLQLRANDIPELKEWLQRKRAWLTHDNQNEILELLAFEVMRKLNNSIKEDEYFSLIVDGTTDVSTKEQVSLCIRHVNGDFEVSEDFIGLYETSSTTGETLTKIIQDVLLRLDLNIDNCRGQCYDGAGNMKGHMKGTQVRISQIEPRATYIHCFNHALNLAVIDATGAVPEFGNVLQNVHELGKYSNKSAKRTDIMLHHKSDDNLALTKNTKLKPLCPTRWTVRLKSLQAVNSQYETVLSALESIKTEDPDPTANGLHSFFEKTLTLFHLELGVLIFEITDELAKKLQISDISITYALAQVDRVQQRLTKLRTDEKFNELWEKVKKRGADMDLLPVTLPRVRAPPKRLEQKSDASPPVTFSGPETYLRKQYFEVLDNLKSDIDYRFQHPGVKIYRDIETVLMKAVNGKTEEVKIEVDNISDHFKTDLDKEKLTSQLNSLQDLPKKKEVKSVRDLVVTLNSEPQENKRFLSEVLKVVKLLLVLPASAATAERTFSCLRRLKTWLRSTMTQKRLNHLAILSVHRDIAKSIDDKHIARMFVNRVESRCAVFGNFKD